MPRDGPSRATSRLTNDIDRIIEIWSDCHRRYGDAGPWLFGEFSIADAMYAPVVSRFTTYQIDVAQPVADYMEAVEREPDWALWATQCRTERGDT